jgi:hypothetical protein
MTEKVKITNQEMEFTKTDNEWLGKISLSDNKQIEITINSTNYTKDIIDWTKIEMFMAYFVAHREEHEKQSLLVLKTLARATKFFPENTIDNGNFIAYGVEILDNSFSIGDNWKFELCFEFDNDGEEPIDPYGYWFVTFSNKGIIGVRRENG